MKIRLLIGALMLSGTAALLAACGGTQPPIGSQGPGQPAALQSAPSLGSARETPRGWIDPVSSHGDLLYVSDAASGDVYVFSYPKGGLVGTLDVDAWNLCGDRYGHVFVTVQGGRILEFPHGGRKPINTLKDSYYPVACSVDPVTDNLAVANESGSVSVYPKSTGQPTVYNVPLVPLFCTYDAAGNLFADSSGAPGVRIVELPKGGIAFQMLTYHGRNNGEPAGLQWADHHLAVGVASPYERRCCGRIFDFSIHGGRGRAISRTHIGGALLNFIIVGSTAIVTTMTNRVAFYPFPGGGKAEKTIKEPHIESYGVVVSAAP